LVAIRASTAVATVSVVTCARAAGRLVALIIIYALVAVKVLNKTFWAGTSEGANQILWKTNNSMMMMQILYISICHRE
jgi:hypothetical protein